MTVSSHRQWSLMKTA